MGEKKKIERTGKRIFDTCIPSIITVGLPLHVFGVAG